MYKEKLKRNSLLPIRYLLIYFSYIKTNICHGVNKCVIVIGKCHNIDLIFFLLLKRNVQNDVNEYCRRRNRKYCVNFNVVQICINFYLFGMATSVRHMKAALKNFIVDFVSYDTKNHSRWTQKL